MVLRRPEVDQAAATRTQAAADFDAASAQVERANRDLERTKIRAPFDAGSAVKRWVSVS